jgi:hypothetical protein
MDSPLEKFIEWYMSLPVPHRQSIVEFVIFFNIGFDDIDTTNMEEHLSISYRSIRMIN